MFIRADRIRIVTDSDRRAIALLAEGFRRLRAQQFQSGQGVATPAPHTAVCGACPDPTTTAAKDGDL